MERLGFTAAVDEWENLPASAGGVSEAVWYVGLSAKHSPQDDPSGPGCDEIPTRALSGARKYSWGVGIGPWYDLPLVGLHGSIRRRRKIAQSTKLQPK
jgi:hypothetical protein